MNNVSDEIDLNQFITLVGSNIAFLKSRWKKLLLALLTGLAIGFLIAYKQAVTYTSKTIFVVEDTKSGAGLSGLASLAGQFGFDLNGSVGGGLISGDNILLYFKSEALVRNTLLKKWDKQNTFADYYLRANGFDKKFNKDFNWKGFNNQSLGKNVLRLKDSILQFVTLNIIKSEIKISRIDKKAGFLELSITSKNEEFAKKFNEELVNTAINQYLNLKTERQKKTVEKLQYRADSIANILNQKVFTSANIQREMSTSDINPLFRTTTSIKTELTTRDKAVLTAIYIEVVKNLEMAKFTLSQETPVIQIVDKPFYPLQTNKISLVNSVIFSSLLFVALMAFFLLVQRWFKKLR